MTKEAKMAYNGQTGLVGRMTDLLSELPALPEIGGIRVGRATAGAAPAAAERRARLALRIAILKRGEPVIVPLVQVDRAPAPVDAQPSAEPPAEPVVAPPPAPPTQKPARKTLSTVRLEDAALLLAAVATPPEPEAGASFKAGLSVPFAIDASPADDNGQPRRTPSAIKDPMDVLAAFSSMAEAAPAPEPISLEAEADAERPAKKPEPARPSGKGKRRSGSVSAVEGLASAAAALTALQMADTEQPVIADPPSPSDSTIADALAALRDAD